VTEEVQVQVESQDGDAERETTTPGSDGGVPGFGLGVTLVALLAAVLVAARSRE